MKLLKAFNLNEEQISKFEKYFSLLVEWNEKFNLTAITSRDEVIEKHFVDSLELVNYVDLKNKSLLDVGSGAGFPGIPLAIAEPTLNVSLLESNGKKVKFLNEVKDQLGLANVTVINGRAEELNKREKYDIVTARAVKELNILLELCFYLVKVGGNFVAYKSVLIDKELENAKHALKVLGIEKYKKYEYSLPISKNNRVLLDILKENKTAKKYPRRYGEISKQPL